MEVTLLSFEDKTSKNNNPYTRFETDKGSMACWDEPVIEELKKKITHRVVVDVVDSKGYKNIKALLAGVVDQTPQATPQNGEDKFTSMYVSYAKDIFVALTANPVKETKSAKEVMDAAIMLVKQAKEGLK
tara:strand:+ start:200 stop:589 length:390 start_codon:yes stop_codon:yes gene_type:complete